ncbi:MAG: transketolase C-terminal domain-containing protein, partial [Ardenticatenales bacterium]
FAQLYADTDPAREPMSAGRQMNAHFSTRFIDEDGAWGDQLSQVNSSADVSPTGSQMPRLVGLAQASKVYRELEALHGMTRFSRRGDEVAWGTIGNATCAEGMFWESVNAIGVLGVPAVLSIWDDGYGISVPGRFAITKDDLSEVLKGFQREPGSMDGYDIYTVRGWDYLALVDAYLEAAAIARRDHVPAIIHVTELTQPQGHSTSGSHERYKTPERLAWEADHDCLPRLRRWILASGIADEPTLDAWEEEDRDWVEAVRTESHDAFLAPIRAERDEAVSLLDALAAEIAGGAAGGGGSGVANAPDGASGAADVVRAVRDALAAIDLPKREDVHIALRKAAIEVRGHDGPARRAMLAWRSAQERINEARFGAHLYSESPQAATNVEAVAPVYSDGSPTLNAFDVLNACFDAALTRDPRILAFGEDLGFIGDVNQAFKGLQDKHGAVRVADTGIREATIVGQAIGLAMRGLRPICEIQYLDYIHYALQLLSDDLACLRWRTNGGQAAPVIIRTRGHRLVGIWHTGSPMAAIIHLCRGIRVCVPRDMTRAAGFYNTLLASDEPGLVVEVLNGYRLKERLPDNIADYRVALGEPEILRAGADITVVTYGACCRIVMEAADVLATMGIDAEVIDVQTLLPFDVPGTIGASIKKTGRVLFVDEDMPGGTTAYMVQEVVERQGAYVDLDGPAETLTAKAHRAAYGNDGDYFSKPQVEHVVQRVNAMMHEVDPAAFPLVWQ